MLANTTFWVTPQALPPVRKRARRVPAPSVHALAQLMLDELRGNGLTVVLVPDRHLGGDDWRRLRCAETRNAAWYREFCGRYESNRRGCFATFKTKIKRRETERALEKLVGEKGRRGEGETPYVSRLLDLIAELRTDGELRRRLELS